LAWYFIGKLKRGGINMRHFFKLFICLAWLSLSACSHPLSPQSTSLLANSQQTHTKNVYPATGFPYWQVGQWSLYKIQSRSHDNMFHLFDGKAKLSFIKIAIISIEERGACLQFITVIEGKEQNLLAYINESQQGNSFSYQLNKLIIQKDNTTDISFTYDELLTGKAAQQYSLVKQWIDLLHYSVRSGYQRNVTLAAGHFKNVTEVPLTISLGLEQKQGYVWFHHAAPIFPVVKIKLTRSSTQWFNSVEIFELVSFSNQHFAPIGSMEPSL